MSKRGFPCRTCLVSMVCNNHKATTCDLLQEITSNNKVRQLLKKHKCPDCGYKVDTRGRFGNIAQTIIEYYYYCPRCERNYEISGNTISRIFIFRDANFGDPITKIKKGQK